ncbi:MAG TPA: tripartite tricarboxylate transporter substrate binding protein [Burkholderiales bacterium]|nr:tripartite tricarboxylate transporter substrate binding protein [Burkholderiales bacterium]
MTPATARGAALIVLLSAAFAAAHAQPFPTRPIRLISPYPPGGGNDVLARLIADKMGEGLGQRVIVDNRAGANTIVGTEIVAKSAADGHTLVLVPNSFVTNVGFYAKLPYDTVRDFAPVALVALSPQMLVVHPSVPATTVKELIALAKAKPGFYSYGSSGNGSVGHLAMALFDMMAGIKTEHIAYKGTAPAVTELLGGQIPLMMSSMLSVLPHVKAGKLRLLAVTTAKRSPAVPDAPTVAEASVPGYEATLWYGLVAAARTPPAVLDKLSSQVDKTLRDPEIIEKLSRQGVEPYYFGPQEFASRVRTEIPKWAKVIKDAGVRIE